MKKFLLLLIIPFLSFGQNYSTYYGTHNVNINSNVNVKNDINVSGNVKKTIHTIDYGALSNAQAQNEKNRIEKLKLENQKEREAMLAIALDPTKAYFYGRTLPRYSMQNADCKKYGLRSVSWQITILHESLFTFPGLKNISEKGIRTDYTNDLPYNINSFSYEAPSEFAKEQHEAIYNLGAEEYAKGKQFKVGEINENFFGRFIHKKDINRTEIYNKDGFLLTIIWEDEYEYGITDYYIAKSDDLVYRNRVSYKGDKDEITFEDLEGRRHYLKPLMDQTMGSLSVYYKKRK